MLKPKTKLYHKEKDDFSPEIEGYRNLERNEYFYLPGRILHIDGDRDYLEKCMNFYKKNRLKAFGVYSTADELVTNVEENLKKYNEE